MLRRRRPPSQDRRVAGNGELSKSMAAGASDGGSSSFATEILALFLVAGFYFALVWIASRCVHEGYLAPLPRSAPLDKFSEQRAMDHVWELAHEIGGRQEGTEGLARAAEYLKAEITALKDRSKSVRLELDESLVSGSFSMHFLRHNVALSYRNHTNVAVRVSAHNATDDQASVLVNGHFDSPLGSPGAGDCASCVASMLEVLRYIVDSGWVPPSPIIFLFNGAEEVFLLASHGFITTHKWRSTVGAVINVEATGASGPDLVVQSGPETWPTRVYAESAVVPGANSVAQDVFPLVPGDTDYRIFSQDFADIPGMDIVFLLNGYVYHTAYDRPEIIASGSIQTRGENLIELLKGFTSAPELKTADQRAQAGGSNTDRHVYFDILGKFMVHYSRKTAQVLHYLPLLIVLAVPYFFSDDLKTSYSAIFDGAVRHGLGCVLAVLFPVMLAAARLILSATAMAWFANPLIAVATFVPVSVAGLLLPRVLSSRPHSTQEKIVASHWGATGLYGLEAAVLILSGAMSSYFPCWWALFMIPAIHVLQLLQKRFGQHSLRSLLGYILPGLLPSAYTIFFVVVFVEFIVEKLGMVGAHPDPFGFFVADVVIAFIMGLAVVVSVGHIIPGLAHILAKPRIIWLLLAISVGVSVGTSGTFPYSTLAPKRIILQHSFRTSGDSIIEASHDFATVDPNPMTFVFKHAPLVRESLATEPTLSQHSGANTFLALYPISLMLSRSFQVPTLAGPPYPQASLPKLLLTESIPGTLGTRRLFFELDLGSLQEVWGAAINVTGPLLNWSLSNQSLPGSEIVNGGPPSYVCRFSGKSSETWKFWMDAKTSPPLRIELGVLDQKLDETTIVLMQKFPLWAAVVAGTTYLSSYEF
ncbi:endoplasmic reticulum metallopeptidase 1 [Selaginella moellendorffii]|nr:endoplasmic reticulum metallopeptidase 1 [Selaginella moellendorffii]|eukprot:XP_002985237.2 endoplasmic reticulum metallopeptidase 1 [Selaginella moellendorffii]